MKLNQLGLACLIAAFAFAGLGFSCDPDIDACEDGYKDCDGECIPEDEECVVECPADRPVRCDDGSCVAEVSECETHEPTCRDAGTCNPNAIVDTDRGNYSTSAYKLRLFSNGQPGTSGGDIISVNAWAKNQDVRYWIVHEVNAQGQLVDMFPTGHRVNRLYDFRDPSGEVVGDQRWVIEHTPDESQYSPLLQIHLVHVPEGYAPDTLKDAASILAAAADEEHTGIWIEPTGWIWLVEVTDQSVGLHRINDITDTDWRPFQETVWKGGFTAHAWMYFLTSDGYNVPLANTPPSWSDPLSPFLADLFQFRGCMGRNVYRGFNEEGDLDYSPYVTRHFLQNCNGSALTSAQCDATPTHADTIGDRMADQTYCADNASGWSMVLSQFPR